MRRHGETDRPSPSLPPGAGSFRLDPDVRNKRRINRSLMVTRVRRGSSCSERFPPQGRVAIITASPQPRDSTRFLIPASKTRRHELYEIFIRCVRFLAVLLSPTERVGRRRRRRGHVRASFLPCLLPACERWSGVLASNKFSELPGAKNVKKKKKRSRKERKTWRKLELELE